MTIQKKIFESIDGREGFWYCYVNVQNDYQISENEKETRPLTNLECETWNRRTYSNFVFLMRGNINENQ